MGGFGYLLRMAGSVFSPDERRVVHFTGFAHGATHYVELVYPTLAVVLAAETGTPLAQVLSWSFLGYLLFGLGALPAGLAADRFGPRRVILAGLLAAGVSTIAASAAEPGWPMAMCLAGMGIGASAYHPAGTGFLTRAVRARGRALGINGIYGNVGIALAPLVTAALATQVGWRATFALTGGVIVATALVFMRVSIPDPPPAALASANDEAALSPSGRRLAIFAVLCLTAMLGGFAYRGNTVAMPAYFAERIEVLDFGVAASLAMMVGIAGQYLGGRVADRRDLRWSYFAFHALSLPMLLLVTASYGLPLLGVTALYVFFALGMQPIENSLYAQLTPERWRSTAFGLKFVLTFGVGSSAVAMVSWTAESRGWAGVYQVLAGVVALLVAGIAVLIVLTRRAHATEPDLAPEARPSETPAV
ncbi:MAG: MFS transporter [Proteobacteria bacterium]|nr:MFS transporter [Pseudomonadota bacterium]MCZ6783152.1 MFS transporter [Pseudomonadota bacterium]